MLTHWYITSWGVAFIPVYSTVMTLALLTHWQIMSLGEWPGVQCHDDTNIPDPLVHHIMGSVLKPCVWCLAHWYIISWVVALNQFHEYTSTPDSLVHYIMGRGPKQGVRCLAPWYIISWVVALDHVYGAMMTLALLN